MKENNFDRIAGCYDFLAWLVFGNYLRKAQTYFLHHIPHHAEVLIVGGGTGWIVEEILRRDPTLKITYLEASQEMINRARARQKLENVEWICGDELAIQHNRFNIIITSFFLDMFSESKLSTVIDKIAAGLTHQGKWLVTDFVSTVWWHRLYLSAMYTFFKIVSAIQTSELPDWQRLLANSGYHCMERKNFFGDFIVSAIFKKSEL